MGISESDVETDLATIASGRADVLADPSAGAAAEAALGQRTAALVRLAALAALDAPPASYGRQVNEAIEAGVTPCDLLALIRAIAPEIGTAKAIAAAPEIMLALGLRIPGVTELG